MIQMRELHPLLEFADVPHPHPVAVKSLIYCLQKFLFMLYHMWYGLYVFTEGKKIFTYLRSYLVKRKKKIFGLNFFEKGVKTNPFE